MGLTHIDDKGHVRMVNVGNKEITSRTAVAEGFIRFRAELAEKLRKEPQTAKGNIFECARIAGIMGAKKTSEIIPMCHPLLITSVGIEFSWVDDRVQATCRVSCQGKTGVEMEALHGVTTALLTLYDMTKALGKESVIEDIRLVRKTGGKSGVWNKRKADR